MVHAPNDNAHDDLLSDRGWLLVDLYRGQEAERDFKQLLERAEVRNDDAMILDASDGLSRAHYVLSLDTPGYADAARESTERVINLARVQGERLRLGKTLLHSVWFVDYDQAYLHVALEHLREAAAIAEELDDEELRLGVMQRMMGFRFFDATIPPIDSDSLVERFSKMRDPVRLNDLYFWLMWNRLSACQFAQCVAACEEGTRTAASIGVPPVQYPTIKSFALTELGRFRRRVCIVGRRGDGC